MRRTSLLRPAHLLACIGFSAALIGCASSGLPPAAAAGGDTANSSSRPAPPPATSIDHLEIRALLLLMSDRRLFEPVSIAGALDATPEIRQQAAMVLGRIGDPRGEPVLESLLGDADPQVRQAAALALGELAERGDHGPCLPC